VNIAGVVTSATTTVKLFLCQKMSPKKIKMDSFFRAKDARDMAKSSVDYPAKHRRTRVLDEIKRASKRGAFLLVLDFDNLYMEARDYDFFESLGYCVERPKERMFIPKGAKLGDPGVRYWVDYGIISWK